MQVSLDRPQETHMWEAFAEAVYEVREGGKPDGEWARQASICNKLCIAVEESAQQNCKPIHVKEWFWSLDISARIFVIAPQEVPLWMLTGLTF